MTVTIWHNPNCTTSRNTLAAIREAGIEPAIVEYLKTAPSRAEIEKAVADAGLTPGQAIRRREAAFAELGLENASDDRLLDAMAERPILIERPFVFAERGVRLCRPAAKVAEILPG